MAWGKRKGLSDEAISYKNVSKHVDIDATWSKKNNYVHFGFKLHVIVDVISHLILNVEITETVNDVQMMTPLVVTLHEIPEHLYADNGYRGEEYVKELA